MPFLAPVIVIFSTFLWQYRAYTSTGTCIKYLYDTKDLDNRTQNAMSLLYLVMWIMLCISLETPLQQVYAQ